MIQLENYQIEQTWNWRILRVGCNRVRNCCCSEVHCSQNAWAEEQCTLNVRTQNQFQLFTAFKPFPVWCLRNVILDIILQNQISMWYNKNVTSELNSILYYQLNFWPSVQMQFHQWYKCLLCYKIVRLLLDHLVLPDGYAPSVARAPGVLLCHNPDTRGMAYSMSSEFAPVPNGAC